MAFPFIGKTEAQDFRLQLYNSFEKRNDLTFELIDALSSQTNPSSGIGLSLSSLFTRKHSSISQLVSQVLEKEKLETIINNYSSALYKNFISGDPSSSKVMFLAADETSIFKQDSNSMEDRGYVHGKTKGISPIGIGHSYSYLVIINEDLPQWVIPFDSKRVKTNESGPLTGIAQFKNFMQLHPENEISVFTADSKYSSFACIEEMYSLGVKALLLSRLNSTRTLYLPFTGEQKSKGAVKKYGDEFKLHDAQTWPKPDYTDDDFKITLQNGKVHQVKLQRWNDLIIKGKKNRPMYNKPFDIVNVIVTHNGEPVYHRNMWLIISGEKRKNINCRQAYLQYKRRFNIEHFFRFSKQELLLGKYQCPNTNTADVWGQISMLSYLNLLTGASLVNSNVLSPWEKHKPIADISTPYQTKRSFLSIVDTLGTPAVPCEYKEHGQGRKLGTILPIKAKQDIVKKAKKPKSKLKLINKDTNTTTEKSSKVSESKKIIFDSVDDIKVKLKLSDEQILLLKNVA